MGFPEVRKVLPCARCVEYRLADPITIYERLAQIAGISRACMSPSIIEHFDPSRNDLSQDGRSVVMREICPERASEDFLVYDLAKSIKSFDT